MSKEVINQFYEAFQRHDPQSMGLLYHDDAQFSDPAFRNLDAHQTRAMWKMLVERSGGNLEIEFHSVIADQEVGQCVWEANYQFSQTGNHVHNVIHATMEFRDGLIIKHTDNFNLWRWSSMALGMPGKLLGWTPLIQGRIRKMAMHSLQKYMEPS